MFFTIVFLIIVTNVWYYVNPLKAKIKPENSYVLIFLMVVFNSEKKIGMRSLKNTPCS